jgi:hypothetical protein
MSYVYARPSALRKAIEFRDVSVREVARQKVADAMTVSQKKKTQVLFAAEAIQHQGSKRGRRRPE